MRKKFKQTAPAIVIATLLMAQTAHAQTSIYYEDFSPRPTGADAPIDTIGWTGYQEENAEAIWATGDTQPSEETGGVWHPTASSTNGNLYANKIDPVLLYTEAGPFGTSNPQYTFGQLENISAELNNGNGRLVNIAIRVGNNWYASETSFTNSGGYVTHTLEDVTTELWFDLTVNPGTELSIGSTAATITDTDLVTAVGIFSAGKDNQVRLGSYKVTAIPEPATMSLLLGGMIGTACMLRRRKRS